MQIARGAHAGLSSAEALAVTIGNRDDAKARERIIERYLNGRLTIGIGDDATLPQQERIEQLARPRAAPTGTAGRQRFTTEVAFTNHLHLRGCGRNAVIAALHHRL